jgi:hypothetical protein
MILLNFSHPLTDEQQDQIEQHTDETVDRLVEVPVQFDEERPFDKQAATLVDACDLGPEEWQQAPILIVPPALSFIAVLVLAELHGRMGYFPPCVRTRPIAGSAPRRYEVAEIMDVQAQRDAARQHRKE